MNRVLWSNSLVFLRSSIWLGQCGKDPSVCECEREWVCVISNPVQEVQHSASSAGEVQHDSRLPPLSFLIASLSFSSFQPLFFTIIHRSDILQLSIRLPSLHILLIQFCCQQLFFFFFLAPLLPTLSSFFSQATLKKKSGWGTYVPMWTSLAKWEPVSEIPNQMWLICVLISVPTGRRYAS